MKRLTGSRSSGRALPPLLGAALWAGAGSIVTLAQAATEPVDQSPPDNPSLVAKPSDIAAGKIVQSPEGAVIGTVHDVLREPNTGRPAYILVTTGSDLKAIPSYAIGHLLRDAHIVIDRLTLAQAPGMPGRDAAADNDYANWKERADDYWSAYR